MKNKVLVEKSTSSGLSKEMEDLVDEFLKENAELMEDLRYQEYWDKVKNHG